MPRRSLKNTLLVLAALLLGLLSLSQSTEARAVADKPRTDKPHPGLPDDVSAVINNHCITCHGPDKQKGGVRLDALDPDFINGIHAEDWHDVLNALNLGEMPPKDQPALADGDRRTLTDWITGELKRAKEAKLGAGGKAVLRRMTRYEYNHTMADLLGIEMDYAQNLPPDSKSSDGFENNGQSLGISPIQMEYYLQAARMGLSKAIVEGDRPKHVDQVITKSGAPARRSAYVGAKDGQVNPGEAFTGRALEFPRQGVVRVRVTLDEVVVPKGAGYPQMRIYMGHRADTIAPSAPFAQADVIPQAEGGSLVYEFTGRIEDMPLPGHNPKFPGIVIVVANVYEPGPDYAALKRKHRDAQKRLTQYERAVVKAEKQGKPIPKRPVIEEVVLPNVPYFVVKSVAFDGPLVDAWPPSHHKQILFDRQSSAVEADYARDVIKRFMSHAYRRPATDAEADRVFDFHESIRPDMPSFESAIREALAMVLISPEFLYLVETQASSGQSNRLTDHELATRLSYFLWSTMPDEALRDAADKGRLSDPKELERQARRLLEDERIHAFVERFTSQWLDLSGVDRVAVNPQYYPGFDDALKADMKQETVEFVSEILRSDLSAMNLIDSDFVMVNRTLAEHYGLSGPKGDAFERVPLTGAERRGGLLTQASVLLMNSNGEDSHPIRRAVWLRDRLLDDPPAPPPPDVPDLDSENPDTAGLSLKRQLELHREKHSCADCHIGIDPWGIPLENYDAVGLWREEVTRRVGKKAVKTPVVSDTELPGGQKVMDVAGLKAVLKTDLKDRFARGLVRYMLTYSLGRSLDYTDSDSVDDLVARFEASGYQLDELIVAITKSQAFNTK